MPGLALKLGAKVFPWACVSRWSIPEHKQATSIHSPITDYCPFCPCPCIRDPGVHWLFHQQGQRAWFSPSGGFVTCRALIISGDFLGFQNQEGKSSYQHLVSRGQSCCQRPSNVQESSHSPSKELPNRKSQFNFQFKPRMRTSVLERFTNSMGFGSRQAWPWLNYNCQRALGK